MSQHFRSEKPQTAGKKTKWEKKDLSILIFASRAIKVSQSSEHHVGRILILNVLDVEQDLRLGRGVVLDVGCIPIESETNDVVEKDSESGREEVEVDELGWRPN